MRRRLLTLMRREWLQHRLGWTLIVVLPLGLALLVAAFGQLRLDEDTMANAGEALSALLAMGVIAGTAALSFAIALISSWIIVAGIARRDHADRSIEFWLSVPVSHTQSLAAPLLVHLLLVPAAALVIGLLGGYAVSLLLVTRAGGPDAWLALPWTDIVPASLMLTLRVLAGLPLATLWFAPLILAVVLLTAWFRRWGWVILTVGIGVGSLLLKRLFGQPLLSDAINGLLQHGARAIVHGGGSGLRIENAGDGFAALHMLPAWALHDLALALRDLASPLFAGGLMFAAACFALLVLWRRRGAGAAG